MNTKVFLETFKGHPTFSVWEVNEDGDKVGSYPVLSMGLKKAKALMSHIDQFAYFASSEKPKQG
jgi:hypothetical protein